MGATRLASGFFQQPRLAEKCNVHTLNKGSQTVLITRQSVSLCLNAPRDASPPLELAFRACVHSLGYISKTDISTRIPHPKSYIANCLHLALFTCTALIINTLRSVGNLIFCLHTACTTCTFCLALPTLFVCTICTCLHTVCTYLHLLAPSSLYTSAPVCMMGYIIHTFRHSGNDFWIRATETTTSRNCLTVCVRTLRHAAWQQSGGSVCVQTSAEKSAGSV